MSPRPGRIVLDEPVPFGIDERLVGLRETPELVCFRGRVAGALRLTAETVAV